MPENNHKNRRSFLKKLGATSLLATGISGLIPETQAASKNIQILKRRSKVPANDRINIACVGMGLMGFGDVDCALKAEGIEFVAAADSYRGHLTSVHERYGEQVKTTMRYEELLDNADIDGIIIATPDHWHARHAVQAIQKKKPIYLEKPMVHKIEEGASILEAQKKHKVPLQVGSQWASSIVVHKAKELYEQGSIGQLNFVEVYTDRFSALGAWQYSIPPDASPETCDWKTFQGGATDLPFDPIRFFRWRNYQAYGTGMAGDLFVHLFTRLHTITGSLGPERIYATGNLNYWKDGRDVPDLMLGLFDYPETKNHPAFNLSLRVNFVDGSGGGDQLRLVGNEGEMVLDDNRVTVKRKTLSKAPGYGGWDTFNTFPEAMKKAFENEYKEKYASLPTEVNAVGELAFESPRGYDMRLDHFNNWFDAIRKGTATVEDAAFGFRAAAPALASNQSYFDRKVVEWDPVNMKLS